MSAIVSFVIPHRGGTEYLIKTLKSIEAQEYPKDKMQIFVVTKEEHLSEEMVVKSDVSTQIIYCDPSVTISTLRNRGANLAEGHYLAFLDADMVLSPNWITAMQWKLQNQRSCVCVACVLTDAKQSTSVEKIATTMYSCKKDKFVDSLNGRNLFLEKRIFHKAGQFPEWLLTSEDIYFTRKVAGLGKLYITDRAKAVHLGEDKTFREVFKKEIWRSESNLASLKGRTIPLTEYPSILIPFWELVFLIGILFSLVFQNFQLTIAFLGAFILPIFLYAIRIYVKEPKKLSFLSCFWFYITYFTARSIGTIKGVMWGGR